MTGDRQLNKKANDFLELNSYLNSNVQKLNKANPFPLLFL